MFNTVSAKSALSDPPVGRDCGLEADGLLSTLLFQFLYFLLCRCS